MPAIDNEAAHRDARRAYLKGLKRGDMITCDLSMRSVGMSCDGRRHTPTTEIPARRCHRRVWFIT